MEGNLALNGLKPFEVKEHKVVFDPDLSILSGAISAIIVLLVRVFLNCVFMIGAGYPVYFAELDNTIVLLCGGDKSSQAQDIQRAKTYWLENTSEGHT